jgi:hypothetical protein
VSTRARKQQAQKAATLTAAALKRSRQVPNTLCMLLTSLPVRVALDCCHPLTPYHIHQPPIHPWHTTDDALPHSTHQLTHQPPVPSLHTTTNTLRRKQKKVLLEHSDGCDGVGPADRARCRGRRGRTIVHRGRAWPRRGCRDGGARCSSGKRPVDHWPIIDEARVSRVALFPPALMLF